MIPEIEAALGTKVLIHNPFYMREGILVKQGENVALLFYAEGYPCITVYDGNDLQPLPLAQQKHSMSQHQFEVGYESGYMAITGLASLVNRLLLASAGVRGPDSYWKLRGAGIEAVYDANSGRKTLWF